MVGGREPHARAVASQLLFVSEAGKSYMRVAVRLQVSKVTLGAGKKNKQQWREEIRLLAVFNRDWDGSWLSVVLHPQPPQTCVAGLMKARK